MELARLIECLSDPAAYPYPAPGVEVRQTHISAVFLVGDYVYKVKKPVNYGFLDFSTLDKRRHYCDEEVRLNRRLALQVYLEVVPVARGKAGLEVEGKGKVVEWAVKMRRLPDEATLRYLLQQRAIGAAVVERLARRIAIFHAQAEAGPHVAAYGRFEVVANNALDNFAQSTNYIGTTVSQAVFERTQSLTEAALDRHHALIERRADRNVPRDTHGDLRLAHVYYFPQRQPPDDLVVIDCIEFSERYRFADPVSDMAFLYMGLIDHGRRDLAEAFAKAYFSESNDQEGRALVPFYTSYRAAVRGKVESMKLARPELSEADLAAARSKATGSWLLALGELETPSRKPCLILIGGLPGTGKSTLARALAERGDFRLIRSDVVRKHLAGLGQTDRAAESFASGIYSAAWTERTYAECLRQAEGSLFEGARVLVDANFRDDDQRVAFLQSAIRHGVPALFLCCHAAPEVVRTRLDDRRGDASDADWTIYLRAKDTWHEPGQLTRTRLHTIDTKGSPEHSLHQAQTVLTQAQLMD